MLREHLVRERDPSLIRRFKNKLSSFSCCICTFDFEKRYGPIGREFIEAHHLDPIGSRDGGTPTSVGEFARAIEGFVADLLIAIAHKERAEGWVRRSVGHDAFTDGVVTYHDFMAIRRALVALALVEETPAILHWNAQSRSATRFRATAALLEMATAHGVSLPDIGNHFVTDLPKHPLVLKGHSRHAPDGDKIPGRKMKFTYTEKLRAMERAIIDLNAFIDGFEIRGGTHRGFIRIFNCGDDQAFDWNLGGRLYLPKRRKRRQRATCLRWTKWSCWTKWS